VYPVRARTFAPSSVAGCSTPGIFYPWCAMVRDLTKHYHAPHNRTAMEATTELFTAAETLDVLTENFVPAADANTADQEVTSLELQLSILDHTGEEHPLAEINKYMKQKGYRTRSNTRLEIVWMMARR
jgi:hypothetical protein